MSKYILLLLLVACNPTRHWRKVAADPKPTAEKKAIIAPKVAELFPSETKYVKGEEVVRIDTIGYETIQIIRDTIIPDSSEKIIVKFRTITTTVTRIDTVYMDAPGTIAQLSSSIIYARKLEGDISALQAKSDDKDKTIDGLKKSKYFFLWWLIGIIIINIVYVCYKAFK